MQDIVTRENLLKRIKTAVRSVDPSAAAILYGSRARGEASPDSDWDILILTNNPVDRELTKRFRQALYGIEFDTGEVLCAIVGARAAWEQELRDRVPFSQSVMAEGEYL